MALKLYGFPMSSPTACVMTCLAEKEVEYELVNVDLSKGEHKFPAYLAKNPFGQIPVLEDGSVTLFESRAITRYIAHKYESGTDLSRNENMEASAMVGVWLEVESKQFNPVIHTIIFEQLIKPVFYHQTPDQSIIDENLAKLVPVLDVYDTRLSYSKYLACDSFTLADLHHLPYIYYFMKTPWTDMIKSRANVRAWWEDISVRPSFVKVAQLIESQV
ncbi:hypothetical protein C5167_021500 [Papaver somniferum]|uniref:glutathione S-transferase F13-like n=1 Tax=Papaver somniferum TaxID=3469 RepID=UPI000E6FD275|nr:glutathione S-transferase F13-like [Papaver somniferum]RZC93550.1 hypothetical protein C5167_021500 [Papaver somniferum]